MYKAQKTVPKTIYPRLISQVYLGTRKFKYLLMLKLILDFLFHSRVYVKNEGAIFSSQLYVHMNVDLFRHMLEKRNSEA